MPELRSKYLAIKTSLEAIPDPSVVVDYIHKPRDEFGLGQPEAAVCWANHPAECGGHPHTHYVVRFPSQVYWGAIRSKLKELGDDHAYSDVGRSWTRSVRYLLHLDNPEKEPIPRENFKFSGLDVSEVEVLLGAPRASLLNDIRSAGAPRSPFDFVHWLVNERGHTPGEVASMIRCVLASSEYIARLAQFENLHNPQVDPADVDGIASIPQGMPQSVDDGGDLLGSDGFGIPEGWE